MQYRRFAEPADKFVPREYGYILNSGGCSLKLGQILVEVFMVHNPNQLLMNHLLDIAGFQRLTIRPFNCYLDNVVMPVAGGIGAFAKNLDILFFAEFFVPQLMGRGKLEFLNAL